MSLNNTVGQYLSKTEIGYEADTSISQCMGDYYQRTLPEEDNAGKKWNACISQRGYLGNLVGLSAALVGGSLTPLLYAQLMADGFQNIFRLCSLRSARHIPTDFSINLSKAYCMGDTLVRKKSSFKIANMPHTGESICKLELAEGEEMCNELQALMRKSSRIT
jgi:hypothetical protein